MLAYDPEILAEDSIGAPRELDSPLTPTALESSPDLPPTLSADWGSLSDAGSIPPGDEEPVPLVAEGPIGPSLALVPLEPSPALEPASMPSEPSPALEPAPLVPLEPLPSPTLPPKRKRRSNPKGNGKGAKEKGGKGKGGKGKGRTSGNKGKAVAKPKAKSKACAKSKAVKKTQTKEAKTPRSWPPYRPNPKNMDDVERKMHSVIRLQINREQS